MIFDMSQNQKNIKRVDFLKNLGAGTFLLFTRKKVTDNEQIDGENKLTPSINNSAIKRTKNKG